MVELDGCDVLEPIADKGLQLGIAHRQEASVHQREGIVDETGMQPGDKAAGDDGQRDERDDRLGGAPPARADGYSLSALGGGEVGDSRALAKTHLTLPSLGDGPLPLPLEGWRGIICLTW